MTTPDGFCPLPLDCSETYGRLVIASVSLHGPAWCAHDLSPIYDTPPFRSENVLVETQAGRVARPALTDEMTVSLRMMMSGATTQTGTPHAHASGGLFANRRTFTTTYLTPIRTGTASLAATLTLPAADAGAPLVYTFGVQPLRLTGWTLLPDAFARTVLEVRIPVPDLLDGAGT